MHFFNEAVGSKIARKQNNATNARPCLLRQCLSAPLTPTPGCVSYADTQPSLASHSPHLDHVLMRSNKEKQCFRIGLFDEIEETTPASVVHGGPLAQSSSAGTSLVLAIVYLFCSSKYMDLSQAIR